MTDEEFETITSEGMIFIAHRWVPVTVVVEPTAETEKAYKAEVSVYEDVEFGQKEILFYNESTWIPKSMAGNVWWICTAKFDHADKVANKRWDVE